MMATPTIAQKNINYTLEEALFVPWSDTALGRNNIPMVSEQDRTLLFTKGSDVRFKALPNGTLLLLSHTSEGPCFLLSPPEGPPPQHLSGAPVDVLTAIPIPAPNLPVSGAWDIVDFAMDEAQNIYLYEHARLEGSRAHLLRKLSPKGEQLWAKTGTINSDAYDVPSFEGDYSQLVMVNDQLYLSSYRYGLLLVGVNTTTGAMQETVHLSGSYGHVRTNGKQVAAVGAGELGTSIHWMNPATGQQAYALIVPQHQQGSYGLLGIGSGHTAYFQSPTGVGRLSEAGVPEQEFPFTPPFVSKTGKVYHWDAAANTVYGWNKGLLTYTNKLKLPKVDKKPLNTVRLYGVDEAENTYFEGRDHQHRSHFWSYNAKGKLQEVATDPQQFFSNRELQLKHKAVADVHGNIYLPVQTPKGLSIVRVNVN